MFDIGSRTRIEDRAKEGMSEYKDRGLRIVNFYMNVRKRE